MRIEISQRLKPYSHRPGTYFMLPGSPYRLKIFPSRLEIDDLSKTIPKPVGSIDLNIRGVVDDFTAIQELEKGTLLIFGHAVNGYFRYGISSAENGTKIALHIEKAPNIIVEGISEGMSTDVLQVIEDPSNFSTDHMSRLSLGNHQIQDWESLGKKKDLSAILPIWHRLGQFYSDCYSSVESEGTAYLLEECRHAIEVNVPQHILGAFYSLFRIGFEGALSPRLLDTDFQGIALPPIGNDSQLSPLVLLSKGSLLIESLFVKQREIDIFLLPALPPEFHCGRLLNIRSIQSGILDLEWTKKTIRRVVFTAQVTGQVSFNFSNHERYCRLRTSQKDRGLRYIPGSLLDVVTGQTYWFDNFER